MSMNFCQKFGIYTVHLLVRLQTYILAPVLPLQIKRRGINTIIIGVIMSAYSFSLFLVPAFVKSVLFSRLERRVLTFIGMFTMSFSLLAYGLEYYIPQDLQFFFAFLSTLTRLTEGIGAATAMTSFLSLAFSLFPDKIEYIFVLRSLGTAGGYSVGLIISYFAYELLGYVGLFVMLFLFSSFLSFTIFCFKKSPILPSQEKRQNQIGYWKVIKIRRVWVSILHNQVTGMVILFAEPTIALKLNKDFGYGPSTIQLYILSYAISATIGALIAQFFQEKCDRRISMVIGSVVITIGTAMVGPSRLLGFPNLAILPAIGLGVAGIAKSIVMIASFPEAAAGAINAYPDNSQEVSDVVTAACVSALGINSLVSPIISSVINRYYGYRALMDWLLLFIFLSGLGYIVSTAYDWKQEAKERREKRARALEEQDDITDETPLKIV